MKHIYEFGPFRLDATERLLLRGGQHVPLTPKAFNVLLVLVENGGHVIDKDELIRKVWPDTFVEEVNLAKNIYSLRKVLCDEQVAQYGEQAAQYIETIPRRGYRFVAGVKEFWGEQTTPFASDGATPDPHDPDQGKEENEKRVDDALEGAPGLFARNILDTKSTDTDSIQRPTLGSHLSSPLIFLSLGLLISIVFWIIWSHPATIMPAPLLKIVPITSFQGSEDQAAFSPDGNQMAFVWNGEKEDNSDIYVKLIGAEMPLQLTTNPAPDVNPAWSPDGRHIAFLRQSAENGGFFLIPALGGPERKLAEAFPYHPVTIGNTMNFSPDGKFLAVPNKLSQEEPFSIFLISIENGEKVKITSPPAGSVGDFYPAFSPDQKQLAFVRSGNIASTDIYLIPATGGEPRRLTFDNTQIRGLSWTSDGSEIVFASRRGSSIYNLWKVSVHNGTPQRLIVSERDAFSPTVSRSGNRLAYTQSLLDVNIWRFNLNDSTARGEPPVRLVSSTQDEDSPNYSPDGRRIVFASRRSGSFEIWVCGSDGSRPRQLTNIGGPLTGTPRWSPDGEQIVFDSWFEGNADIYVISANGGRPRRLTTESSEDITPSWSRDGRWIYFGSNRDGSMQIWKVPAAGGQAVPITKHGGFEGFESTDGQYFYYAKGRAVPGIWRVPVSGGEETLMLNHHQAGLWRYWVVTEKGIYFATAETPSHPIIEFLSFATKKIKLVAMLDKPLLKTLPGLSVSPDGSWLVIAQIDQNGSDIMLVENIW